MCFLHGLDDCENRALTFLFFTYNCAAHTHTRTSSHNTFALQALIPASRHLLRLESVLCKFELGRAADRHTASERCYQRSFVSLLALAFAQLA